MNLLNITYQQIRVTIQIFIIFLTLLLMTCNTKVQAGEYDQFGIYCSGYWSYSGSYGSHTCIESFTAAPSECDYGYKRSLTDGCIPSTAMDCGNGTYCPSGTYCSSEDSTCPSIPSEPGPGFD